MNQSKRCHWPTRPPCTPTLVGTECVYSLTTSVTRLPDYESWIAQQSTPPQFSIYFIGFQFGSELILKWINSSTVHSTSSALNTCHHYYTSTIITSASLCLTQSPRPTPYPHCSFLSWSSACWPFLFGIPSFLIWDLLTHTLPSNLISDHNCFKFILKVFWKFLCLLLVQNGIQNCLSG